MVVQYSPLQLTYASDKLPAFSGLADEMYRHSKREYLAGLRRSTLIPDMCWYRERSSRGPYMDHLPQYPSADQRAPTWSWASVYGPIRYPSMLYHAGWLATGINLKQYAKVLGAACSPTGPSLTGQVSGGFVDLRCTIIPVRLHEGRIDMDLIDIGSICTRIYWNPDGRFDGEAELQGECYAIPLASMVGRRFVALIVKATSRDLDHFTRIGLVEYSPPFRRSFIREVPAGEERTVRIV
jgi:hypothetical protein